MKTTTCTRTRSTNMTAPTMHITLSNRSVAGSAWDSSAAAKRTAAVTASTIVIKTAKPSSSAAGGTQ